MECTSSSERTAKATETNESSTFRQLDAPSDSSQASHAFQFSADERTILSIPNTREHPEVHSNGTEVDVNRHNSFSYPVPSIQDHSSLPASQSLQVLPWTASNHQPSGDASRMGPSTAVATQPETNTRHVHFSPQAQMQQQEISDPTAIPTEFDFDFNFNNLVQNDETEDWPFYHDQEGWSNIFPGINSVSISATASLLGDAQLTIRYTAM